MIALIIFISIFVSILSLILFSHLFYHRTLIATVAEWYLRLTEKHYTESELLALIDERVKNGDTPYVLPRKTESRLSFSYEEYRGMQLFRLNEQFSSEKAVIYLHGGAYFRKPRKYHIRFAEKLSNETKTPIMLPIYNKAPNHTCEEAYGVLTEFYLELRRKYKKVILMGDSSGGGLALGLALYLSKAGIGIPDSLVLLSPWVDVALENPEIEKYERVDPIVFLDNVKLLGKKWAGDLSLSDFRVSPIKSEMKGLCETHIFCGTRELLYPDCNLLYEKIKSSGVSAHFYVGEGQNHVYPIYPIPEARRARKIIGGIINTR